ncbi:MAG: hypothetical protein INQ03_07925 [Candidatus Heimdallarchaeota archaeon]|nr:hypothetical protein [Candidatus Heimdallarchaeota archaeon]
MDDYTEQRIKILYVALGVYFIATFLPIVKSVGYTNTDLVYTLNESILNGNVMSAILHLAAFVLVVFAIIRMNAEAEVKKILFGSIGSSILSILFGLILGGGALNYISQVENVRSTMTWGVIFLVIAWGFIVFAAFTYEPEVEEEMEHKMRKGPYRPSEEEEEDKYTVRKGPYQSFEEESTPPYTPPYTPKISGKSCSTCGQRDEEKMGYCAFCGAKIE